MTELKNAVTGYVLAGGRSQRMGQDKALLELGGRSLIERAVGKLQRVTGTARILSSRRELAAYAPLVPDLRDDCGPLGGIEAAFADARSEWIFVLPVDMPFVPSWLLRSWIESVVQKKDARVAFFDVEGILCPAMCLLHRQVAPSISDAAEEGRLKLYPAFREAAVELAKAAEVSLDEVLVLSYWDGMSADAFFRSAASHKSSFLPSGRRVEHLWFINLNTPEDFAVAEQSIDLLED